MTICIASRCFASNSIVSAYDANISLGDVISGDLPIKNQILIGRWRMMIAGNDISPAWPIHRRARHKLATSGTAENDLSLDQVSRAIAEAYQEELKQAKQDQVLGPYGQEMGNFLREGRKAFGNKLYEELFFKMEEIQFSLDLLVYGFEERTGAKNLPHIFKVSNPGEIASRTLIGFAAIGSGSLTAMGSLMGQKMASLSEIDVIYKLCEAKFLSETAIGVGRDSYLGVLDADGTERIILTKQLEELRKVWETEGRPKTPPSAAALIEAELKKAKIRTLGGLNIAL